ncbi:hypothetical protein FLO80_02285 [Aquicoccus porphyridii]|uniref:Uncharacterized protein n=1 Tax=Aquicoccus porphyridii TaxID=1852029 RepID=A0A5A9ZVF3_9RHOB|nr:hypothetical protein [Aquicoccus porphyridii]KAA0921021.1 hypothetical protein FLO80_02285 [Aquicoccus porphyridii]RAI56442.1 hypothetical protein DOO74_00795 [Rhodobacteraceae bacterium AsT-22]
MWKWIICLVLVGITGFIGYAGYHSYQKGYFNLPEFSETSYALSFRNGFRGIVVDPEVSNPLESSPRFFRRLNLANPERRYFTLAFDVPSWFEKTWSFCHPPTDEERAVIERDMPDEVKREIIGGRLDGVCKIEVDGESIWRGLIYSVPKQ